MPNIHRYIRTQIAGGIIHQNKPVPTTTTNVLDHVQNLKRTQNNHYQVSNIPKNMIILKTSPPPPKKKKLGKPKENTTNPTNKQKILHSNITSHPHHHHLRSLRRLLRGVAPLEEEFSTATTSQLLNTAPPGFYGRRKRG